MPVCGVESGKSYRDLVAARKEMASVKESYRALKFPKRMRLTDDGSAAAPGRLSASIIAEGRPLSPTQVAPIRQFYWVEAETQIMVARDLDYLAPTAAGTLLVAAALGRSPERAHRFQEMSRQGLESVA